MICENCNKREATGRWVGTADSLSVATGRAPGSQWCDRCMLEAMLAHARARAAEIPGLEAALAALEDEP